MHIIFVPEYCKLSEFLSIKILALVMMMTALQLIPHLWVVIILSTRNPQYWNSQHAQSLHLGKEMKLIFFCKQQVCSQHLLHPTVIFPNDIEKTKYTLDAL